MKLCYNEACGRDCSTLETDLRLCEELGFDYIEIRLDMLSRYLWTHTMGELRNWFASHRLKPHALNAVYLQGGLLSERASAGENQKFLEQFCFALYAAEELGSGAVIVVPPFSLDGGPYQGEREEAEADCVRMLSHLGRLAEERGIRLCFEIVGLRKSAVRTMDAAKRVVEAVNLPNVGYVVDSYNLYLYHQMNDFSGMASLGLERLFAAHINNADLVPEEEMAQSCRRFPDQGVVNLDNYLRALREMGYDGMISVETFRPEYWRRPPEWVVRTAYDTTREVLERNGCWEKEDTL